MILGAEIQDMSVDQLAGAIVLVLGAVGSLLLVIWQSRCACKCRIGISDKCYLFECNRQPPPAENEGDSKKKKGSAKNKEDDIEKGKTDAEKVDDEVIVPPVVREPEPEPEP